MKSYRFRLVLIGVAVLLTGALGYFFESAYYHSDRRWIPFELFKKEWEKKEKDTEQTLTQLSQLIERGQLSAVKTFDFKNNDIGYYVFKAGNLIYWNNNQMDVLTMNNLETDRFCTLSNVYGVVKSCKIEDYEIVGLIKIKNNYKSTNVYTQNEFAKGFRIDSNIGIDTTMPDSPYAIFSNSGKYLFSLSYKSEIVSDTTYAYLSLLFWWLCVGFFFLLYYYLGVWASKKEKRPFQTFLFVMLAYMAIVTVFLHLNVPQILFEMTIFSPIYYGSGTLLSSLGHLLIVTTFCCLTIAIFYFHVPLKVVRKKSAGTYLYIALVQMMSLCFYGVIVWLFSDMNNNSSVELSLYSVDHVSPYSLTAFVVVACWLMAFVLLRDKCVALVKVCTSYGSLVVQNIALSIIFSLAFYLCNKQFLCHVSLWYFLLCSLIDYFRFGKNRPISYQLLAVVVFVFSHFVSWFIYSRQEQKRVEKYSVIAENMMLKDNGSYDIVSETILEEVENEIKNDANIQRYLTYENQKISNEQIVHYLTKYYFKNYWNAYNINVQVLPKNDKTNDRYKNLIASDDVKQYNTKYFYCNNVKDNLFDYLGVFSYPHRNDTVMLYVELVAKEKMNYGYSDAVFDKGSGAGLNITSAKYEGEILQWQWGKYKYPNLYVFANDSSDTGKIVCANGYKHYFFSYPHDVHIIISEKRPNDIAAYLLFWTYVFAMYLAIVFIGNFIFLRVEKIRLGNSLFSRIRQQFVVYVVICLAVVFCISIVYIYVQYSTSQRNEQLAVTRYVKTEMEAFCSDNEVLNNTAAINFFIHDLSKMYETDIHLYSAEGKLLSTSVPYVFARGLMGKLINPMPYFNHQNQELIQTENIGTFKYLASYAPVVDANSRVQAYVCLPAFLSYKELNSDLFNLLAIFLNIYFVIVVLSSIIGVFLSERLSMPIKTIKEKLQAIKLGKKNEKIDYTYTAGNDEIGMLIMQYNLMVDQLSESVELLAQSERELAWREMARQIAHEIKNPLTPMKLTIQQLQRTKQMDAATFDNYFNKTADVLIEQIDNLSRIATEFSNFARMPAAKLVRLNIADKLVSVVNLFKNNYEEVDIVYLSTIEKAFIKADSEQMTQLFNNLLKNAIQSIPPNRAGKIQIELDIIQPQVVISVSDNGVGISPDIQAKMFAPNFTTKSSGMGLGLSIVKSIVTASRGEILFTTKENEGTKFIVKFPLVK
jgi:two-component system, NtrC family, nitrogen regulation sensor histidine kinase NtrY